MDTIPPLSLPILLDGATGSELYKRGMPAGACTEQWVLGHPEALLELQRGYVAAGSQVLIAPTFGANRVRLEQHGIFGQVADYIWARAWLRVVAVRGGTHGGEWEQRGRNFKALF